MGFLITCLVYQAEDRPGGQQGLGVGSVGNLEAVLTVVGRVVEQGGELGERDDQVV